MEKLTEKESEMLKFITEFTRDNGFPPSVRDIQHGLNYKSTSTVHSCLNRLTEKGALNKASHRSRSLRTGEVSIDSPTYIKVPLVGKVTAGMPILAVQNIEGYLDFPLVKRSYRESSSTLFALRVQGESMIEAGIMDGDIIVVQKEDTAENGEIVVAMVDDSATVKSFYRENGRYRLQPHNPHMDPIVVDDCTILGKVISVMRFYN